MSVAALVAITCRFGAGLPHRARLGPNRERRSDQQLGRASAAAASTARLAQERIAS